MEKRRFSTRQQISLRLAYGKDGEFDHIKPYSRGGATSLDNAQILSPRANRLKGASDMSCNFRAWQNEFLHVYTMKQRGKPFLMVSPPGAGKTKAAIEAMRRWLDYGSDRRVVVVAPTVDVKKGWMDSCHGAGIELCPTPADLKDGYHGIIVTYQGLESLQDTIGVFCRNRYAGKVMAVADEIHHCATDKAFGQRLSTAFDGAAEVLLLSGTPWRTNGTPISFVRYENNMSVPDYQYSYAQAVSDKVIRSLHITSYNGKLYDLCAEKTKSLNVDTSEQECSEILGRIIHADGEYAKAMILEAHEKLMRLRDKTPDAAGLIIAKDIFQANIFCKFVSKLCGSQQSLITSFDEMSNDDVKKFRNAKTPWVVSVRKISEGVDIPRLQVLVYLTNVIAELFYRQALGRVARMRGSSVEVGYVFQPAHPILIQHKHNIDKECGALLSTEQPAPQTTERAAAVRSEASFDYETAPDGVHGEISVDGKLYDAAVYQEAQRVCTILGSDLDATYQILRTAGWNGGNNSAEAPSEETPRFDQELPLHEREQKKRKQCARLVAQIAHKHQAPHEKIHKYFMRRFGRGQERLSMHQLDEKIRVLRDMLDAQNLSAWGVAG